MTPEIVDFALRYQVVPKDAYVLPALLEHSAKLARMSLKDLLAETATNEPLGEYLANAARRVAAEDRA
jgi:hypothetical protein